MTSKHKIICDICGKSRRSITLFKGIAYCGTCLMLRGVHQYYHTKDESQVKGGKDANGC